LAVPLHQTIRVGAYVLGRHLRGVRRYPLVLMLEPLFRCNLACAGCGKIDYPDAILNQRLSIDECLDAVDQCGAPVVVLAGGEPLLHRDIDEISALIMAQKKFVYLCTNALLLEKKIHLFKPSPYFAWTVHLDGDREDHDRSVCQEGVYDRAIAAIKLSKARGFRVNINATLFDTAEPDRIARFFDAVTEIGIDGITVSPGYAYERAPDQQHFLNRRRTKELFRSIFAHGSRRWSFNQSGLFLDFLAGNQSYYCTPWGNPTRNYFGWQRPCYLLGEGYAKTFKELMEDTDWDAYGTGNYEKCADCMVHSGYEATAVMDSVRNPLKVAHVALRGIRTRGDMAAEIPLDRQRPAKYVFSRHVQDAMTRLGGSTNESSQRLSRAD
jgi:hopanoid biosynthesis associated radical SAM protein HpnH